MKLMGRVVGSHGTGQEMKAHTSRLGGRILHHPIESVIRQRALASLGSDRLRGANSKGRHTASSSNHRRREGWSSDAGFSLVEGCL
jgi:hypothetical protein